MLLGDFIAQLTGKMGIKPCPPCKARQAKLNQLHAQMTGRAPPLDTFVIETRDGQVVSRR
jgi:hypothetical protein